MWLLCHRDPMGDQCEVKLIWHRRVCDYHPQPLFWQPHHWTAQIHLTPLRSERLHGLMLADVLNNIYLQTLIIVFCNLVDEIEKYNSCVKNRI